MLGILLGGGLAGWIATYALEDDEAIATFMKLAVAGPIGLVAILTFALQGPVCVGTPPVCTPTDPVMLALGLTPLLLFGVGAVAGHSLAKDRRRST